MPCLRRPLARLDCAFSPDHDPSACPRTPPLPLVHPFSVPPLKLNHGAHQANGPQVDRRQRFVPHPSNQASSPPLTARSRSLTDLTATDRLLPPSDQPLASSSPPRPRARRLPQPAASRSPTATARGRSPCARSGATRSQPSSSSASSRSSGSSVRSRRTSRRTFAFSRRASLLLRPASLP